MATDEENFKAILAKMKKAETAFRADLVNASSALVQSEVVKNLAQVYKTEITSTEASFKNPKQNSRAKL